MEKNGAVVKDMEAASIAWLADTAGVPLIALKGKFLSYSLSLWLIINFIFFLVVTDIVDGDIPTQDEFLENLGKASISLQEKLPKIIDLLLGKTFETI